MEQLYKENEKDVDFFLGGGGGMSIDGMSDYLVVWEKRYGQHIHTL